MLESLENFHDISNLQARAIPLIQTKFEPRLRPEYAFTHSLTSKITIYILDVPENNVPIWWSADFDVMKK